MDGCKNKVKNRNSACILDFGKCFEYSAYANEFELLALDSSVSTVYFVAAATTQDLLMIWVHPLLCLKPINLILQILYSLTCKKC